MNKHKTPNNAKSRQLAAEWEALNRKWKPNVIPANSKPQSYCGSDLAIPDGRDARRLPSRDTGMGVATIKPTPRYTGSSIIGISVIHKSCLQPVFSKQAAIDVAEMRR